MATLSGGRPVLVIVDVSQPTTGKRSRSTTSEKFTTRAGRLTASESFCSRPQGRVVRFVPILLRPGKVEQLTADPYADLHPAWSPDGRTIALTTDRLRVGSTTSIRRLAHRCSTSTPASSVPYDGSTEAKQVSPQWSPDGSGVYFISDRDGTSNVYRAEVVSGALRQVSDVPGAHRHHLDHPALACRPRRNARFSVYRNGRYEIETLTKCRPARTTGRS